MSTADRLAAALADRYRIERELGAGGMATVYLAEDLKHDRKVAIKVLKPELAAVLGAERFVQEIKTTAALQHPHILPLFDSGEAGGFLYYVMPYIQGETIREKLNRETQFGIEEAVRIATEVADALHYAHQQGVIHRDIKPENILLHDGRPMVMDFGIALAVSAAAGGRMTETGLSLGTPHYMSPEQATAEKDLTNRSDIYSLGAVLYEMLAGDPPHTGSSAQQIIMKIVTDEARPLTDLRRSVPPHVVVAAARALEKLPADRFATAGAFAEVLRGERQIAPGPASVSGERRPPAAAWRGALLGLGAGALLASGAVLGLRQPAPRPIEYWTIAAPPELDTVPLEQILDFSPEEDRLASVALTDDGVRMLQVRRIDQPEGTWLRGTEGASSPRFSPDGERIAFFTPTGTVSWIPVDGGTPQVVAETAEYVGLSQYQGLCWGEDDFIYFQRPSTDTLATGMSRLPSRGGEIENLTTIDTTRGESGHACVQVVEDRGVVFKVDRAGGSEVQELGGYAFATGERTTLTRGLYGRLTSRPSFVYLSVEGVLRAAPFDTRTMTMTGPPVNLIGNVYRNADWGSFLLSREGTLVYQELTPAQSRLAWVDRAGRVTGIDTELRELGAPALAPSGDRVAVPVNGRPGRELWVFQLPEGPWTRLVETGGPDRPAWHPDGSRVTYVAFTGDGRTTVFQVTADGGTPPSLLRPLSSVPVQDGEFTPDGQWIVYRQGPVGPTQRDILYSRPHPDSTAYELVVTYDDELAPTVSPDGRWVAFASNASGRHEIFVQPFPGPGPRVQVSLEGGFEPRWAHSGRELFYRDLGGDFVSVEVTAGTRFTVGERQTLFSADRFLNDRYAVFYDVARDDQRFLFVETVTGGDVAWKLVRGFDRIADEQLER